MRITATFLSTILLLVHPIACTQSPTKTIVFPSKTWQTASPESQGVSALRLNKAVDFLNARFGDEGNLRTMIVRNGYVIWEGPRVHEKHNLYSCTKVFTSTVLGLLIDDEICNLETRASKHVPDLNPQYPNVNLRHLATMTSGYVAQGDENQGKTPFKPSKPFFPPGTNFQYWDSPMNQLANVLTQIVEKPIESIFRSRIANPIGINPVDWEWKNWGTVNGRLVNGGAGNWGKGIHMSASNLARFGLLFLNHGLWNGKRLISSRWVELSTTVQVPSSVPNFGKRRRWNGAGIYGFNWWINGIDAAGHRPWPNSPPNTYAMIGQDSHFCMIIPEWNMVIVRFGTDEDGVMDNEDFDTLLTQISAAILF